MKFFDGMDDDGSELQSLLLVYVTDVAIGWIPHFRLTNSCVWGVVFQILKAVGDSTRTVEMYQDHLLRMTILFSQGHSKCSIPV